MEQYEGKFVIVVGREYGSGGRRIARMLAEKLGVSYYDRTLLSEAATRMGYSPEIFERKDEKRPSLIRSILSFTYGAPTASIDSAPMSDEKIYEYQSRVIRDICERESCVIVGRTADYVMRDHPRLLSIFIHSPLEKRVEAIIRRGETSDRERASEIARHHDSCRQSFYNYYTNRDSWGKASNYHLSFDSTLLDDFSILKAVKTMLNHRNEQNNDSES